MEQSCSIDLLKYILSLLISCVIFAGVGGGREGGPFCLGRSTAPQEDNPLCPLA